MIAAIHNACIGAGVDLLCSTDIRYCTSDAWFQVKEVDIGELFLGLLGLIFSELFED